MVKNALHPLNPPPCSAKILTESKVKRRLLMNIFNILIVGLLFILGVGTSVVIIGYMLVILAQKIFNKIKYGKSLYD